MRLVGYNAATPWGLRRDPMTGHDPKDLQDRGRAA